MSFSTGDRSQEVRETEFCTVYIFADCADSLEGKVVERKAIRKRHVRRLLQRLVYEK